MIKAKHSFWGGLLLDKYILNLLKRRFRSFRLIGDAPIVPDDVPIMLTPNHSYWWDGFFVHLINKRFFNRKLYLMMLEKELTKYRFFTKGGAFSIEPRSPKKIHESVQYSASILTNRSDKNLICIFPQGDLTPVFEKPYVFRGGFLKIASSSGARVCVVPLAMRVNYLNEEYPDVFFKFGGSEILEPDSNYKPELFAKSLQSAMKDIENSIICGDFGKIFETGKKFSPDQPGNEL